MRLFQISIGSLRSDLYQLDSVLSNSFVMSFYKKKIIDLSKNQYFNASGKWSLKSSIRN